MQNTTKTSLAGPGKVPVWDLPTRLFHWMLVLLIILAYVTNTYSEALGGFHWHKLTGYTILSLILFRVMWGFVGSSTSRFWNFIHPFAAFGYLAGLASGKARHYLGHNPAGAMMVLALLVVVGAQAITGLFSADDVTLMLFAGPFASSVAESTVETASRFHRIGFNLILVLAALHVLANLAYTVFRRDDLIGAMVTGRKKAGDYFDAPAATIASSMRALICFVIAVAIVFGSVYAYGDGPFM